MMEKGKSKQVAMKLILSGLFALLVMYIAFWIYDVVARTGSFVKNESQDPAFACVGYMYDARLASTDGSTLSFELLNRKYSDYPIESISIITDTGKFAEVDIGRLVPGKAKMVEVEIGINNTFKIFPADCELYGKLVEVGANG